jgi:predicted Zn-dependent protease
MRVARESVRKALESHNPQTLGPGTYTVILEPQAVGDLLSFFSYYFDARRADEGRSPFSVPGGSTKLGEKLFDESVNLYSDPASPEIPRPAATWEGIPAQKIWMVRAGAVETLWYQRFWAKKRNKQPTPGPVNTILEGSGTKVSIEEMIRAMERGLLVSRFWYIRETDPRTAACTGLTRDGLWYIENGKILRPVRNFRFNQSLLEMLAPGNIERFGVPERISSSLLMPALLLKQFHFTSESDAV